VQRGADWDRWLPPELSFRVDASGSIPGLSHSHYNALQVKNALVDGQRRRWGARSSVDLDDPDLSLHLHLSPGRPGQTPQATLSLDGSGDSLHRRGYRAAMGLAPLKENLAAGLIRLTGWDGSVPLADPLCGSGTLLIEAACIALGRQPGLDRRFALERWPDFDGRLWNREVEAAAALEADALADGRPLAPIVGQELDPAVLLQRLLSRGREDDTEAVIRNRLVVKDSTGRLMVMGRNVAIVILDSKKEAVASYAIPAGAHVVVFEGKIGSLRRFKDDVSEVKTGFECGIGFDKFNDLRIGDKIEVFTMERVATPA